MFLYGFSIANYRVKLIFHNVLIVLYIYGVRVLGINYDYVLIKYKGFWV